MKKSKIKLILEDYWTDFLKIYNKQIRRNVKDEVKKVLRCKDIRHGLYRV